MPLNITEHAGGGYGGYGWGYGRVSGMSQNVMQEITGSGSDIGDTIALGKISIRARVGVTFGLKQK